MAADTARWWAEDNEKPPSPNPSLNNLTPISTDLDKIQPLEADPDQVFSVKQLRQGHDCRGGDLSWRWLLIPDVL
ncbi:hypothetical protein V2J09_006345 [Rumex salicifolius]